MAALSKITTETVEKPVIEIVKVPTYWLGLTKEQADTLCVILKSVGGNPRTSHRKHVYAIQDALRDMHIHVPFTLSEQWKDRASASKGGIYFADNSLSMK